MEIVTQTLLNQLGVHSGQEYPTVDQQWKSGGQFFKALLFEYIFDKKSVWNPFLFTPKKALFVELAARLNISHSRVVVVLRQHY